MPSGAYPVRVNADALAEDLAHTTPAGQDVGEALAGELSRGTFTGELRRCDPEGRDGTRLGGCVKTYLPPPAGPWGAVFEIRRDDSGVYLAFLAFGRRHPEQPWRPSVYRVADRRLHPET